jgi:hypothetical protein
MIESNARGDHTMHDDDDHITQDDLQQLHFAIRNCSDLVEHAEARLTDALIDDDARRREEHKAVLDAITELRREVALLKVGLDAHDDGQDSEYEYVDSGQVDYLEEPIMVRRPRR